MKKKTSGSDEKREAGAPDSPAIGMSGVESPRNAFLRYQISPSPSPRSLL